MTVLPWIRHSLSAHTPLLRNTGLTSRVAGPCSRALSSCKRTHSTFNGGGVVPSLNQRNLGKRILWGTLGTSFFMLAIYGGYSYRRSRPREQAVLNQASRPSPSPETLIREIDLQHFASVDWNNPVQTTLYFRSLVRASMVGTSPDRNESPTPIPKGVDARTKRFTEHFLHLVNLLLSLPEDSLQNFVRQGKVLEGRELEIFEKTVEGERIRMHEVMKDAAHQVHSKVAGGNPPSVSRTSGGGGLEAGEIGREVGQVLSEAYEALAEIASQDSRRIYRVMKALFAVEMVMFAVG
ncbi:hypothetical protein GYMLUDRAFT_41126 [Collybiopsis luxurians FD-317 M1]|uniref:Uncharacterized protein n=1 Tax=Collybiopsis luxurians FD-317 M1 TaxID=944289 RepID=A0A0D0BHJ6_9AGAR|nr:hypothetical protein GYMLUDRAFT_41126 [Collybiopsis luxurians FD-317 M1]